MIRRGWRTLGGLTGLPKSAGVTFPSPKSAVVWWPKRKEKCRGGARSNEWPRRPYSPVSFCCIERLTARLGQVTKPGWGALPVTTATTATTARSCSCNSLIRVHETSVTSALHPNPERRRWLGPAISLHTTLHSMRIESNRIESRLAGQEGEECTALHAVACT